MSNWKKVALDLYKHQSQECVVYKTYLKAIGSEPNEIEDVRDIPFMPIELFKNFIIKTDEWKTEHVFQSSGTTSSIRSKHYVRTINDYLTHTQSIFESSFNTLNNYVLVALLPGYSPDSSLVTMVRHFISQTGTDHSGFYSTPESYDHLEEKLNYCQKKGLRVVLFGVTHSLLTFVKDRKIDGTGLIVIETGGMKGMGEELTRFEVHNILRDSLTGCKIYSEYGMTELLSQAYSDEEGIFYSNDFLHVLPGDLYDPLSLTSYGSNARLNIIDVANKNTCAFIATADIGKVYEDGRFEVLGRQDYADIRGCNLLFEPQN